MQKLTTLLFLALTLSNTYAQGNSDNESAGLTSLIEQGGFSLTVLLIISFFCLTLSIYLLMTIRLELIAPTDFITEAEKVADTHDFEALKAICRKEKTPAAEVIGAAAIELDLNPESSYQIIRDAVEDEGNRQANAIWQKVQYLMDIAVIAPMIGLLGTVIGMRDSFTGIQNGFGQVKPMNLASGIGKALITTAAGLILGITAMIIHAYFRGRVNRILSEMESRCGRVLRTFASKNK